MRYLEAISLLPILSAIVPGVSARYINHEVRDTDNKGETGALFLDMGMFTCIKHELDEDPERCVDWMHYENRFTVWNHATSASNATWTFTAFANQSTGEHHDLPDGNPLTTIQCNITTCPGQRTENSTIVINNFAPFVREIDPNGLTEIECTGVKDGDVLKDDTPSQHGECSV